MSNIDFPSKKQNTHYTCSKAALASLSTYFGNHMDEDDVPASPTVGMRLGMLPFEFRYRFDKLVPDCSMKTVVSPNEDIPGAIELSLDKGNPLPLIYCTENTMKDNEVYPHYSSAIGMEGHHVVLADPLGERTIPIDKLLSYMAYENYDFPHLHIKWAMRAGLLRPNTFFLIE